MRPPTTTHRAHGPRCTVCYGPLNPDVAAAEPHHTTHPTCDPHENRARATWLARERAQGRNPK